MQTGPQRPETYLSDGRVYIDGHALVSLWSFFITHFDNLSHFWCLSRCWLAGSHPTKAQDLGSGIDSKRNLQISLFIESTFKALHSFLCLYHNNYNTVVSSTMATNRPRASPAPFEVKPAEYGRWHIVLLNGRFVDRIKVLLDAFFVYGGSLPRLLLSG
jgi:hypothetical protein